MSTEHETRDLPISGPQHWAAVAEKLGTVSNALGDRLGEPLPVPGPDGDYVRWRKLWVAHDGEVIQAMEEWLGGGELPSDPVTVFLFWVRAHSACGLARLASVTQPDLLFFKPFLSVDETIRALFGGWWYGGGDLDGFRRMNELQYLGREMRPGQPVRVPVTTWAQVLPRAESLLESLHHFSTVATEANTPAKPEGWDRLWLPTAKEQEEAVEAWLASGAIPDDPEVGYWFWMRTAAMLCLVRQLAHVDLFEPRHESMHGVLRYFLTTWWGKKGQVMMWEGRNLAARGTTWKT